MYVQGEYYDGRRFKGNQCSVVENLVFCRGYESIYSISGW